MTALLAFLLAGIATYALRSAASVTSVIARSRRVEAWIALVAPAVLASIVAGAVMLEQGRPVAPDPAETVAVVLAAVAVKRTANVSAALAVGLPAFWLASIFLG